MKKVLIVTDMQNDFISGSLGSPDACAIEENAVAKILHFDGEILYTLDTHTEDYLTTQEGKRLPIAHCIAGTNGWAPSAAIWMALKERDVADEMHMVVKDTFGAKELPLRIHELFPDDPDEIVLIGLCTDICVISNAMVLKAFFPETRIVIDAACCAGASKDGHRQALAAMQVCQIDIENA